MMDLNLVLEKIRPGQAYLLNSSVPPHKIIEWRGEGTEPTPEELYRGWLECLTEKKNEVWKAFNEEMNAYIVSRYDLGSQLSLIIFYILTGNEDIKKAWQWVFDVLGYYYEVKAQILGASTYEELEGLAWGFSQFDAKDPDVKLESFFTPLPPPPLE